MNVPFVDRSPTFEEFEQFRLILSTYQDGTGMLKAKNGTLPGWRDFERAAAEAFGGQAIESKWIYDVLLTDQAGALYGMSCKMRGTLRNLQNNGRVTIELTNASGEFWGAIKSLNLTQENYHTAPELVGKTIIRVVESWHEVVGIEQGGEVDNTKSFYLVLQWDRQRAAYQLFHFPIDLPEPNKLSWEVAGRRLIGRDGEGILFEWYGFSGGQLKYYPLAKNALWQSSVFQLEPLPTDLDFSVRYKAATYFPALWSRIQP